MSKGIAVHRAEFCQSGCLQRMERTLAGCINDTREHVPDRDAGRLQRHLLTDAQASAAGDARIRLDGAPAGWQVTSAWSRTPAGSQITDVTGDEPDGKDETWVWDRQLLDDELNGLWSGFATGVRIFLAVRRCHSGTIGAGHELSEEFKSAGRCGRMNAPPRIRALPISRPCQLRPTRPTGQPVVTPRGGQPPASR
jgi:hypothetical protein